MFRRPPRLSYLGFPSRMKSDFTKVKQAPCATAHGAFVIRGKGEIDTRRCLDDIHGKAMMIYNFSEIDDIPPTADGIQGLSLDER